MLDQARALWTILEHEEMHQETLGYIWHQVPYSWKHKPNGYVTVTRSETPATVSSRVRIPSGVATLGTDLRETAFAWDNERPLHRVHVDAFTIDAHNVTNGQFLEFLHQGGYRERKWWRPEDWQWIESESVSHPFFWQHEGDRWFWRGMFERVPLPRDVARVRHVGGGQRVRPLAGIAIANRARVSACGVRDARWSRAQLPVG